MDLCDCPNLVNLVVLEAGESTKHKRVLLCLGLLKLRSVITCQSRGVMARSLRSKRARRNRAAIREKRKDWHLQNLKQIVAHFDEEKDGSRQVDMAEESEERPPKVDGAENEALQGGLSHLCRKHRL